MRTTLFPRRHALPFGVALALAFICAGPACNEPLLLPPESDVGDIPPASLSVDDLSAADEGLKPGRLLVKFKPGVGQARREKVLGGHGAREVGHIPQIGVRILELPVKASEKAMAKAMHGRPEFEFAEVDHVYAPALVPNDPLYDQPYLPQWALPQIEAPGAWDITTGDSDVIIAILDSGLYTEHEDLAGKTVPGWNVYDDNGDTTDVNGHGTLVAGVAGAATNNGIGMASVGWDCMIMPVRVSAPSGWSTTELLAEGIVWAADHGARVANISFEGPDGDDALGSALLYLAGTGGVTVMSSGNSGMVSPEPANPNIIRVSATNPDDEVTSWSVTGDIIDLAAPGVGLITTHRTGTYANASGTSVSAPVVSGVAALMIAANPDLAGQQEIQDILFATADDLDPSGWDPESGWGRVNAANAVQMALDYDGEDPPADTEPPSVVITAPDNGQLVSGQITVDASASDNQEVASVDLYVDGQLLATDTNSPYLFYWDTTEVDSGAHVLQATAADDSGNTATDEIGVEVDNTAPDTQPPTVEIISPEPESTVSGVISVEVAASDDTAVYSIILWVGDTAWETDTAAPYVFSLDTGELPNGGYILSAVAYDLAGNPGESTPVPISVSNDAGGSEQVMQIGGTVNRRFPDRTFDIQTTAEGPLTAEITWNDRKGSLRGTILDATGATLDTATSGNSPLVLDAGTVQPGSYSVVVSRVDRNVSFTLTVTHW